MRIVFCGTPQFAVPSLKHLLTQKDFEIVSVYTQPDRPRGRGQEISFSPVKEVAVGGGRVWGAPGRGGGRGGGERPRGVGGGGSVGIAGWENIPAVVAAVLVRG